MPTPSMKKGCVYIEFWWHIVFFDDRWDDDYGRSENDDEKCHVDDCGEREYLPI